jgi:predicted nuclease with TOPRIM domain
MSTDERLDAALKRRDGLAADVQRIEGRLEAARTTLTEIEEECRAKGIEPDQLDATIQKVETRYKSLVTTLEQEVEAASTALGPYLQEQ